MNTSTPSSPSQKGFISLLVIGIIIFVLTFVAGAFYWRLYPLKNNPSICCAIPSTQPVTSQTPDPTANWKTYNGSLYTFKYPPAWQIKNVPIDDGSLQDTFLSFQTSPDHYVGSISDVKNVQNEGVDLTFCINNLKDQTRCESMTIDGKQVIIDWQQLPKNGAYEPVNANIFVSSKDTLHITYGGMPSDIKNNFKVFLSTFTFTDQVSTPTTKQTCQTVSDCPGGDTCEVTGPIVDTPKRVCVPKGQMVPF